MSITVIPRPAPLPSSPAGLLQRLSSDDLESQLLTLAGHIAAAECRFLQLLAEFDDRGGWCGDGIRSCAHWLSWRAGMNLRTATEHLRVAHALQRPPKITEAFAAGKISYSKARAITRATGTDTATLTRIGAAIAAGDPHWRHTRVTDPETAERVLLNVALCGTASHIETVVAAVRRLHTPPQDTAARRSLTWRTDDDGSLLVRVRLTPEAGAAFIAAIQALVPPKTPARYSDAPAPEGLDERAREQEPGPAIDRMAARRADALLALVTGTSTASTSTTGTEPRTAGDSTASDSAARDSAARGGDEGPVVERGNTQVVVHLDVSSGTARIAGGPEIAASTAERLACDARVQLLLDDREGNRMYLGRSRRLATPAQITALMARDGERCQFPGCTHTHYLQAHHVRHWLHGGPTDIDNLVLICSFHHLAIHDHGYRVRRRPERWEFLRPDGTPIPTPITLSGRTESLIEMHTWDRLQIDRKTLSPQWYGERLDVHPIIDALLPRKTRAAA